MRILHLGTASSQGSNWFEDHFNYICKQLGHEGETRIIPFTNLTAENADIWWRLGKEYYESFDAVFISHLAQLSRIFLQNNWQKPLYVWLYFRFDFFDPENAADQKVYRELIREARTRPNVKFFAASEHDRIYIQRVLGEFPIEIVPPMVFINSDEKKPIPGIENKFYMVSKHNETLFMNLRATLDKLGIPVYNHSWLAGPPDLRGARGIIHIPYHYVPRSLYENLAIENVYFLPSEGFFNHLRCKPNFFWDLPNTTTAEVKLAEWYTEDKKDLFIYFSSFEELAMLTKSDYLIAKKKQNIRVWAPQYNALTLAKWARVFS